MLDLRHLDIEAWDTIVVPVSGGKDSQAVLQLAVGTAGVRDRLVCVHQHTGYDHPLTMQHLDYMASHYGVEIITTRHHQFVDIFDLVEKEHYFPSSVARSCTSRMKIVPFAKWLWDSKLATPRTIVLMGMRGGESRNRAEQYSATDAQDLFSICDISKDYKKRLAAIKVNLPIVHLSTGQVFDYLASREAAVNPLYAKGHKRVGCYPCLLAGEKEWELAARDPVGQANISKLLDIEARFASQPSKYKLIKIHPERDVQEILYRGLQGRVDPFGLLDDDEDSACAQCMT